MTLTHDRMARIALLKKQAGVDLLREMLAFAAERMMEADVEALIGAARHESSGERTTRRNGYRENAFDTRLSTLNLWVPKLRQGSYFPGFLDACKTLEQALVGVIQEVLISGVSTRRVDEPVRVMGLNGISKRTVSKLCVQHGC
jgi:transposase-like protein